MITDEPVYETYVTVKVVTAHPFPHDAVTAYVTDVLNHVAFDTSYARIDEEVNDAVTHIEGV